MSYIDILLNIITYSFSTLELVVVVLAILIIALYIVDDALKVSDKHRFINKLRKVIYNLLFLFIIFGFILFFAGELLLLL